MKLTCKYCDRYICEVEGTAILENLVCPNSKCKAHLNVKIVTPDSTAEQINYRFKCREIPPKARG